MTHKMFDIIRNMIFIFKFCSNYKQFYLKKSGEDMPGNSNEPITNATPRILFDTYFIGFFNSDSKILFI